MIDIDACKALSSTFGAFLNDSRAALREEIRAALDKHGVQGHERTFIANYLMSVHGYGGGF